MRKFLLLLLAWSMACFAYAQNIILPQPSTEPSESQRKQIERKYGMFMHFGINTFHDEE